MLILIAKYTNYQGHWNGTESAESIELLILFFTDTCLLWCMVQPIKGDVQQLNGVEKIAQYKQEFNHSILLRALICNLNDLSCFVQGVLGWDIRVEGQLYH